MMSRWPDEFDDVSYNVAYWCSWGSVYSYWAALPCTSYEQSGRTKMSVNLFRRGCSMMRVG